MPQNSENSSAFLIGSATDPGSTGKNNEDALAVFEVDWQDDLKLRRVQVAVVADGIGGNNAGEIASKIAVEKVQTTMRSQPTVAIVTRMEQAAQLANQEIFNTGQSNPALVGMGSTLVVAAIADDLLQVIHVGDSRAYVVRNGSAHRLTLDHTWAQEAIDIGRLSPEAARLHPNRNVIKRYLGVDETLDVDHAMIDIDKAAGEMEGPGRWPMVEQMRLLPGDTVLLCSDGLTDELSDAELQSAVRKYEPQAAATQLVAMANAHGGRDNITVVLLRVPGGAATPAAAAAGVAAANGKSRLPLVLLPLAALALGAALAVFLLSRSAGSGGDGPTPAPAAATPGSAAVAVPATRANEPVAAAVVGAPTETPTVPAIAPTASGQSGPALPAAAGDVPTSTPIPTRTPTPLPPTIAPTATPRPGQTAAPAGRLTATSAVGAPAAGSVSVALVSPAPGEKATGTQQFVWQTSAGSLAPGQAFELRLWKPGQDAIRDGVGLVGTTTGNQALLDLAVADESLGAQFEPGDFEWGVVLVQTSPYRPLRLVSEARRLTYERAQSQPEEQAPPTDTPEPEPTLVP